MSGIGSLLHWQINWKRDRLAAVAGLLFALALVPLWLVGSQVHLRTVPVVLAGGCLLYLATARDTRSFSYDDWTVGAYGVVGAQIVGIGLAALVAVAVVSGGRTVPFLLLAGGVAALIFLQILLLADDTLSPAAILAQVVGFGVVVRFAGLLTTPGVIGVDGWTHITQYATAILESGSLGVIAESKYYASPFYHLVVASSAGLLDLSPRMAAYLTVGVTIPLAALLVYAAARYFVPARWALLAAAMFSVGDHVVRWGLHVIPTSLGLVFFLAALFYVVRLIHAETTWLDTAALAAIAVAVTLTHQVSAFITLSLLGVAVLAEKLAARAGSTAADSTVGDESTSLTGVFLFHLVFTALVWSVTPWQGSRFLFRAVELLLVTLERSAGFLNLVGGSGGGGAGAGEASLAAAVAPYVDAAGFLLLLFVAIVGSLALLGRNRSDQTTYTIIGGITVTLTFAFVLPLFGIRVFLPGRWFAFAYALLAIAGAVGVWHITESYPSRRVMASVVVLLLVLPGAMLVGQKATIDNPTFEDQWPEYAYSESELAAVETIGDVVPASAPSVHTDHPYRTVFARTDTHPSATINLTESGIAPGTTNGSTPELLVYRTYQSEGAPQFTAAGGAVVTRQLTRDQACPTSRNHIYDNQNTMLCTPSDISEGDGPVTAVEGAWRFSPGWLA